MGRELVPGISPEELQYQGLKREGRTGKADQEGEAIEVGGKSKQCDFLEANFYLNFFLGDIQKILNIQV